MYKKKQLDPMMSPRISFSNDFAEASHKKKASYRDAPVSSDFEFLVNDYSMMSADELFSKGKILPTFKGKTTTLRDELRNEDDDFSSKPPKSPARFRGFFGLRRAHVGSKKSTDQNVQSSKNLQDCDE